MESQYPDEVPLPIPAPLKAHMEDDCFWILRCHRLLILPRKPSVEDILRQFYTHSMATTTEETNPSLLAEILDGIKVYFDFTLEDHLLYAPEREQFRTAVEQQATSRSTHKSSTSSKPNEESKNAAANLATNSSHSNSLLEHTSSHAPLPVMPSQVYGAEHLLRLFLKFPLFLSRAQMPPNHIQLLHSHFKELFSFICSNRSEWFLEENYDSGTLSLGSSTTGSGEGAQTEPAQERQPALS